MSTETDQLHPGDLVTYRLHECGINRHTYVVPGETFRGMVNTGHGRVPCESVTRQARPTDHDLLDERQVEQLTLLVRFGVVEGHLRDELFTVLQHVRAMHCGVCSSATVYAAPVWEVMGGREQLPWDGRDSDRAIAVHVLNLVDADARRFSLGHHETWSDQEPTR